MSVFGGDSWAREAQYRKRRLDDLITDNIIDNASSVYKKLSNGKFTCLVCSHSPILDTPTVLLAHVNGSHHKMAESKRKDKNFSIQQEVQKRIALSGNVNTSSGPIKHRKTISKPLIERTRKAASEVLSSSSRTEVKPVSSVVMLRGKDVGGGHCCEMKAGVEGGAGNVVSSGYRERLEKELKFTAAGWKRDGYGKWFKDENAEFDSDDEDPNIVLNGTA